MVLGAHHKFSSHQRPSVTHVFFTAQHHHGANIGVPQRHWKWNHKHNFQPQPEFASLLGAFLLSDIEASLWFSFSLASQGSWKCQIFATGSADKSPEHRGLKAAFRNHKFQIACLRSSRNKSKYPELSRMKNCRDFSGCDFNLQRFRTFEIAAFSGR